jgi:hypothetical protein
VNVGGRIPARLSWQTVPAYLKVSSRRHKYASKRLHMVRNIKNSSLFLINQFYISQLTVQKYVHYILLNRISLGGEGILGLETEATHEAQNEYFKARYVQARGTNVSSSGYHDEDG